MKKSIRFFLQLLWYGEGRHTQHGRLLLLAKLHRENFPPHTHLRYANIVHIGKEDYGTQGIFLANLGLSLPGFLLMIASDWANGSMPQIWGRMVIDILASIICILNFDAYIPDNIDAVLKFLFIAFCFISHFFWSLTYVFLVFYENIFCLFD